MYSKEEIEKDFEGSVDTSLDISLYEYGLIHKKEDDGYVFIYGVGLKDMEGDPTYYLFDDAHFDEDDFEDMIEEGGWFDINAVLSSVGMNKEEWLKMPLFSRVYDMILYYGWENIFGSCYCPYEIA